MNSQLPHQYLERLVDLLDPAANRIENMAVEEARRRVLHGSYSGKLLTLFALSEKYDLII